jgi:hypothetical protein
MGEPLTSTLTAADIERAAAELDVDPAAIRAIDEVESRGSGFLADGRPVILFERHILYRQLKKHGRDADGLARIYAPLVDPTPGGYRGGVGEWYRLNLARQIDRAAADESTSWGRYQIMGFHWRACGFSDVAEFVAAMSESEARQLDAFVRFIAADPALHKALKDCRWADVARRYNGPAYRKNDYDGKLVAAYARYRAANVATGAQA